MTNDEILGTT